VCRGAAIHEQAIRVTGIVLDVIEVQPIDRMLDSQELAE
jgi:hypothetical protein